MRERMEEKRMEKGKRERGLKRNMNGGMDQIGGEDIDSLLLPE